MIKKIDIFNSIALLANVGEGKTLTLNKIAAYALKKGWKVCIIGDSRQFKSVTCLQEPIYLECSKELVPEKVSNLSIVANLFTDNKFNQIESGFLYEIVNSHDVILIDETPYVLSDLIGEKKLLDLVKYCNVHEKKLVVTAQKLEQLVSLDEYIEYTKIPNGNDYMFNTVISQNELL